MVTMARRQLAAVPLMFGLVLANLVSTFGKLECEDLPVEDCAFSVASSGTRCVLEKYKGKDGSTRYECQSSIIMAEKQEEWIESDECVKSCGLERMSVGLSTDLLMDSHFTDMFCSSECINNCPNLIDLYISLAAGEGMYLPQLCKSHKLTYRRSIPDPVKKAMSDAEYHHRRFFPRSTSGGAMGPAGSETGTYPGTYDTPPSGYDTPSYETPPSDGGAQRSGPGYSRYDYRGEIAPTYPVAGSPGSAPLTTPMSALTPTPTPTPGPSTNKRPFFVASSPPTPTPVAATPETGAVTPPEIAPFSYESSSASAPEIAPAPSPGQGEVALYWQTLASEEANLDRSQLTDEEYLYETYFH